MVTHYEILGVSSTATGDEIRKAYHERARQLHPDHVAGHAETESDAARRAMQDVNEAWRVLREPQSRAAYDRSLRNATMTWARPVPMPPDGDDDLDRPFHGRPVAPGDLTVALVRAAPWVAILVVLTAIIVFTAYARRTDSKADLIGHCIVTEEGVPKDVPCDEPNDGLVVDIVDRQDACGTTMTARVVASGDWFCLESRDAG